MIEVDNEAYIGMQLPNQISVCCNLAEGSARISATDQHRFYEIAFGSAVEVVNLLIICCDLEYLSGGDYEMIRTEMEKLTWQINNLSGKKPPGTVRKPEIPADGVDERLSGG